MTTFVPEFEHLPPHDNIVSTYWSQKKIKFAPYLYIWPPQKYENDGKVLFLKRGVSVEIVLSDIRLLSIKTDLSISVL
jgi:hypothetical protein